MRSARFIVKFIFYFAFVIACSVFYSWERLDRSLGGLVENKQLEVRSNLFSAPLKKRGLSRKERFQYHCPYIPPHAESIIDIFSNKTVTDLRNHVSHFNKRRPIIVIVANQQGISCGQLDVHIQNDPSWPAN